MLAFGIQAENFLRSLSLYYIIPPLRKVIPNETKIVGIYAALVKDSVTEKRKE